MRSRLRIAAAGAIVLASACASSTPPAPGAPTLRIGVDLPISGGEARAAVPALNGIRFFVQTHPTLDGYNVALVLADDASSGIPKPSLGAANVRSRSEERRVGRGCC